MENNFEFEERQSTCSVCGKNYTQKFVPYIKQWIGECPCVIESRKSEESRLKELKRKRKIEENILKSGIPKLYKDSSFDNFDIRKGTEQALRVSKRFADIFKECSEKGQGILFIGNTGSGKTHLAISIAKEVLMKGYTVKFVSLLNLMGSVSTDDFGISEALKIQELSKCKLLIIDDICVTNAGDRCKRILFNIIDNRVNAVKSTIFTSNIINVDEIKTSLNEQIFDRIAGSCVTINVSAESYRRKKQ